VPRIRRKIDGALNLHNLGAGNNGSNNNYTTNNANTSTKEKPVINVAELETKTLNDLREMARKLDISGVSGLKNQPLI
jgi:transcription termination factor Rho